jgi:gliding motility-associated-like protein
VPDQPTADQHPFERPDRLSSPQVPAITALFSVQGTDKSQVQFEPHEVSKGMSYHWDFGDGQESHEQAPTHVYEQTGNYYATLTVTNGQGSTVTSGQEVTIERKGDLQVANIITPNADGYNDVFDPAGLDEGVQIDYLLIMDLRGEKVYESTSDPQWDGRLASGEEAPNGVYIYLLRGKDKNNGIIEKSSKLTVKR